MNRVAYVSTYPPRKCGLATYTYHLREHVQNANLWKGPDPVVVLSDGGGFDGKGTFLWPLARDNREEYVRMAKMINNSTVSVVSLQHEFGIFGGEAGSYVLDFIRQLEKPLIVTFHTVFQAPEEPYRSIQQEIALRSDRIIVMNRKAVAYIKDAFHIPGEKIVFIPHGAPVASPAMRKAYREQLSWADRKVMMTFGLLSRGKGIEMILRILPEIAAAVPDVLYAVVGQTHPEVKKKEGESYREELQRMIRALGLEDHVVMIDRYITEEDLVKHLMACDLYITPYPGMQQITSGTLAYAVGLGRPVLSTPYSYAQDLLEHYEELLIPYGQDSEWTRKIIGILSDPTALGEWERRMARIGAELQWPVVGEKHALLFREVANAVKDDGGRKIASL